MIFSKKTTVCKVLIVLVLCAALLSACAKPGAGQTEKGDRIRIVTTIFPIYDWVKNITDGSSTADITLLMDSGADLHNYQPSAEDIIRISECDLLVYIGGESDEWVEDVLKNKTNPDMVALNLMELLGDRARTEELAEGMQTEEEEEEEEEGPEYDEHIWLSVKNAQVLVDALTGSLSALDPDNGALYAENGRAYQEQLAALDRQYQAAVDSAAVKTLLFGDRFPFRYLVDDYGLTYYAAFIGCSAETEASFETISFLAQKVDELKLRYVMTLEGTSHKIAETVIRNTESKDQQILSMDSMQSVTADMVRSGADYLGIMRRNLDVLTQALNN